MRPWRQLVRTTLREWRLLLLILALTGLTSVISVSRPWPLKILADCVVGQAQHPDAFPKLTNWGLSGITPVRAVALAAVASLTVQSIFALLEGATAWTWTLLGQRLANRLSVDLFGRILRLPFSVWRRYTTGDLLSRLSTDTAALSKLMNGVLIAPVTALLSLVLMLGVAWRLDPELAGWCFATAPLMAATTVAFGKPVRRRNRRAREAQGRMASFVQQTLAAMPLIQVFHTEARNTLQLAALANETAALTKRGLMLSRSQALATGLISVTGGAIILYVGGKKALAGSISIGTFLIFVTYLRSAQHALESLLRLYGSFQPLWVGLERVFELLQRSPEEVADEPDSRPLQPHGGRPPSIHFEDVTFGYEKGRPVLERLTLAIEPGESVALVGLSGAGKSTVLSLIPRLYDPWHGRVLVNGQDVRRLTLVSLREQISFVFQTPYLLRRTVAENIRYGRPAASHEAVVAAARAAQAKDFILRLPRGFDTLLGERGSTFSGGEKQRLSIARAYLHDAPILLFDEPTSACDVTTEAELIEVLRELAAEKTVLIAAHRLSTVEWVDRIVVFEHGQVVEFGSHDELLGRRGRYYHFNRLQSAGGGAEVAA